MGWQVVDSLPVRSLVHPCAGACLSMEEYFARAMPEAEGKSEFGAFTVRPHSHQRPKALPPSNLRHSFRKHPRSSTPPPANCSCHFRNCRFLKLQTPFELSSASERTACKALSQTFLPAQVLPARDFAGVASCQRQSVTLFALRFLPAATILAVLLVRPLSPHDCCLPAAGCTGPSSHQ